MCSVHEFPGLLGGSSVSWAHPIGSGQRGLAQAALQIRRLRLDGLGWDDPVLPHGPASGEPAHVPSYDSWTGLPERVGGTGTQLLLLRSIGQRNRKGQPRCKV